MTPRILKILSISIVCIIVLYLIGKIVFTNLGAPIHSSVYSQENLVSSFNLSPPKAEKSANKFNETLPESSSRLVITTGKIHMVVKDIEETSKKITEYTKKRNIQKIKKDGW